MPRWSFNNYRLRGRLSVKLSIVPKNLCKKTRNVSYWIIWGYILVDDKGGFYFLNKTLFCVCPGGVMAKGQDWRIVVREFELQSLSDKYTWENNGPIYPAMFSRRMALALYNLRMLICHWTNKPLLPSFFCSVAYVFSVCFFFDKPVFFSNCIFLIAFSTISF